MNEDSQSEMVCFGAKSRNGKSGSDNSSAPPEKLKNEAIIRKGKSEGKRLFMKSDDEFLTESVVKTGAKNKTALKKRQAISQTKRFIQTTSF